LMTAKESHDQLGELLVARGKLSDEAEGRLSFVEGIVQFCEANAMRKKHIEGNDEAAERLLEEASGLFLATHRLWTKWYGEEHPETVKATTMLGVLNTVLGRKDQAIEWTRKEYQFRVKLFGARHPRTEKCKASLRALLGDDEEIICDSDHALRQELSEADRYSESNVDPGEISWDTDPFAMEEKWSVESVMRMFSETGVTETYGIPRLTLAKLVVTAKAGYVASNSFHNWRHAWSVTMTSFIMIQSPSVTKYLGPRERLAVLVATLCHDITHPGVNSDFLIKTADPMALKFPTPNCLELHHLDLTMQMLAPGCETDILVNCGDVERSYIVSLIRDLILATDMGQHKSIVADLTALAGPGGLLDTDPESVSDATRREFLKGIVHASDLSGQALPPAIACQFGKRVLEEFHTQHEREVRENLVESAFMKDLHLPLAQAKTQLGFLHYVAGPLWAAISTLFPDFTTQYQNILNRAHEIDFDNIANWGALHGGLVAMNRRRNSGSSGSSSLLRDRSVSLAESPTFHRMRSLDCDDIVSRSRSDEVRSRSDRTRSDGASLSIASADSFGSRNQDFAGMSLDRPCLGSQVGELKGDGSPSLASLPLHPALGE